ncbi:hypothetical protein EFN46_10660 [Leuconostoc pseudomesenteroides]|uniref:hypothetical protein n=1 Tax=Leuconostoc pseudomesenteroides TaxID=33968 RepID=UPI0021AAAA06|nr:hypothetical protein [Leuconostoc pseudomesenteroides]MCT4388654.1 hypothetical protein [Leuconostoc pseudomesenteroides]
MNDLKKTKTYKSAVRDLTHAIGAAVVDAIVLTLLFIWPNKVILFLFIVGAIYLILISIATYFSIKELKSYLLLNDFRNNTDSDL